MSKCGILCSYGFLKRVIRVTLGYIRVGVRFRVQGLRFRGFGFQFRA